MGMFRRCFFWEDFLWCFFGRIWRMKKFILNWIQGDESGISQGLDLGIFQRFSMFLYFKCCPFLLIDFLPHSFLDGSKQQQHFKNTWNIEKTQHSKCEEWRVDPDKSIQTSIKDIVKGFNYLPSNSAINDSKHKPYQETCTETKNLCAYTFINNTYCSILVYFYQETTQKLPEPRTHEIHHVTSRPPPEPLKTSPLTLGSNQGWQIQMQGGPLGWNKSTFRYALKKRPFIGVMTQGPTLWKWKFSQFRRHFFWIPQWKERVMFSSFHIFSVSVSVLRGFGVWCCDKTFMSKLTCSTRTEYILFYTETQVISVAPQNPPWTTWTYIIIYLAKPTQVMSRCVWFHLAIPWGQLDPLENQLKKVNFPQENPKWVTISVRNLWFFWASTQT